MDVAEEGSVVVTNDQVPGHPQPRFQVEHWCASAGKREGDGRLLIRHERGSVGFYLHLEIANGMCKAV